VTGLCVAQASLRMIPGEELEQGPIEILAVQKRRMMGNHRSPQFTWWMASLQSRRQPCEQEREKVWGRCPQHLVCPCTAKRALARQKPVQRPVQKRLSADLQGAACDARCRVRTSDILLVRQALYR
jgi:hypothetical protein